MTHQAAALFDPPWQWPAAAALPAAGDCEVWRLDLDAVEGVGQALRGDGPLDASELARARRFVFEHDGRRFVAARLALRRILGAALGCAPAALAIDAPPLQRPRVAGAAGIDFSLSHSGRLALVAVARAAPLGVDVEEWRPVPDAAALAARLFTAAECETLRAAAQDGQPVSAAEAAFLTCWTRKEAVLKSTGLGLSVEPRTVAVGATAAQHDLRFAGCGGEGGIGNEVLLRVRSFAVGPEGVGAIALPPRLRVSRWLRGPPA
jgi:4'-phosphopantetheinyl transferase